MTADPATNTYMVCGYKSWNRASFDSIIVKYPGTWHFIDSKEKLTLDALKKVQPRYVFFLHWSWIVPEEILNAFECVNFHMTDLPYGRGGSPLQNLIMAGHREKTKLSAIRMVPELDAGPVYFKTDLSLEGTAQEVLTRQSDQSAKMIERMMQEEPEPVPQKGDVVVFERRTSEQSEIPELDSAQQLYDFIRMLDGEGYPRAFIEHGGHRYEFSDAELDGDTVQARVIVQKRD
jgi:methionyl-tRNA formyltransferase